MSLQAEPLMNRSPQNQTTVLILGANGRLGCAAAQAFDTAGWQVLAQVRQGPSPLLPTRARVLRMDLGDAGALAAIARGAKVVLHAVNPVYTRWDAEALPALRAGLDVAQSLQAHFMLPGNVYNFGESMPALLHEDTPQRPSTRKGQIRVEMEALVGQRATTGGFAASVLRAGDFFGAGTGGWLDLVIAKRLLQGKLVYPGPLDPVHAWAYLPDLARAFVRVAERGAPSGLVNWNFTGHSLTGHELLLAIENAAASLGLQAARPYRHAGLPWALMRAGGLFVPMWREVAAMAYLWRVPHALEGARLAALATGTSDTTPLAVAMRNALQALGFGPAPLARPAHG
jgi:nucleoside-diphosphate-sugar epimerase